MKPTDEFPFARLVTSEMSDLPMHIPDESNAPRYMELMISLPAEWKIDEESFKDESWYWPVRLLKFLARLPHKYDTWLGFGHTIPNGDPPAPYAESTSFCGAIVLPSVTVPEGFHALPIKPGKEIVFHSVVPLYVEEMNLKLRKGTDRLLELFDEKNLDDVVNVGRVNVARKRFGLF